MALVIPSALQGRVQWTQPLNMDHAPQNVFGINIDTVVYGTHTQAKTDLIRNAFDSAFTTAALASSIHNSCDPTTMVVTDLRTASSPQFFSALASNSTGTADPLPGEVALVTSLKSPTRGKSYRGRWYWPGFVSGVNTSTGRPTSTVCAACTLFMTTFNTNLATIAGVQGLGVISRTLGIISSAPNYSTNTAWDSQRRRGFH